MRETYSSTDLPDALRAGCDALQLELDKSQFDALLSYLDLLERWNQSYNLSAIRSKREMLVKHLFDSLALVPLIRDDSGRRYLDVGTGAGLPGLPLAICLPDKHFELLDSAGKKMRFLFQVQQQLQLDNLVLHNTRVEAFQPETAYDGIVSRAFSSLESFVTLCAHLLAENGKFWAMKGQKPETELSALQKPYIVLAHYPLEVPELDAERCVVVLGRE